VASLDFVELFLTCGSRQEAEKIAGVLLEKRLVVCVKFIPIESKFWWKGKIKTNQEILLLMESVAENFEQTEAEVAKLHSYDTFVLKQLDITNLSVKALNWLAEATKQR